jgi:hypothetical protein
LTPVFLLLDKSFKVCLHETALFYVPYSKLVLYGISWCCTALPKACCVVLQTIRNISIFCCPTQYALGKRFFCRTTHCHTTHCAIRQKVLFRVNTTLIRWKKLTFCSAFPFQCAANGHVVCGPCHTKLLRGCPMCRLG